MRAAKFNIRKSSVFLSLIIGIVIILTKPGYADLMSFSDSSFSWTTDTSTGLDWLDFDGGAAPATSQRPYSDVAAQLGPGGDYDGWRFASRAEVYQFVLNITGLSSLTAAPNTSSSQDGATDLVAAWTGYTRRVGTLDVVHGFTGDLSGSSVYYSGLFDYYVQPNQVSNYTIWIPGTLVNTTGVYDDLGSWLVRGSSPNPIPEPSTMLLFGSGVAGLGLWRYRKSVNV